MDHLDEVWRTKDGKEIPVCQMSEEYAKNIIRRFIKHKRFKDNYDELMDNISDSMFEGGDRW